MIKAVITSLLLLLPLVLSDELSEDNWIQPWKSVEVLSDIKVDSSNAIKNDEDSKEPFELLFYKKFILSLFNRQKLQFDSRTSKYERLMHFIILPDQLEKLESLKSARDLDGVLMQILANAQTPYKCGDTSSGWSGWSIFFSIFRIFKYILELLHIAEVHFFLIATATMLLGWYVHRRYGIGIIIIIFCGMVLFGYFATYIECNRKLDVERMLEVIENQEKNVQNDSSMFSYIASFFGSKTSTQLSKGDLLRKSSKLNLPYCRPDHVVMLYANDIFLKQLEVLIEKCYTTITTLKDTLPFPMNYLASVMVIVLIAYILKLTFKYILTPSAWACIFYHRSQQQFPQQPAMHSGVSAIIEDRISGENLRLLLSAMSVVTPKFAVSNTKETTEFAVSGVEEVLEQIKQADTTDSSSSSSLSSSTAATTNSNSPNNSNSADAMEQSQNDVDEVVGICAKAQASEKLLNNTEHMDAVEVTPTAALPTDNL